MKRYLLLIALMAWVLSHKVMADDVRQQTDGDFVGDSYSFTGGNTQQQTDKAFAWFNEEPSGNNFFAGSDYSRQVKSSLDGPFAGDSSKSRTDGVFIGGDTQKQAGGSAGDYGR
ncbi:MAG: hypothetical protein KGJ09_03920 [Candidatus Omnitrophica bacterium]|nr:hypothetical protein [Candidatus Omnitrophota bacterium]MDE2009207.1 hypothetical protein [Candidatus Omnitrophota bacterium]MDE2213728.1 hypothetical protein [Candidatus Omnitrophota bacterium]MDE2230697.1 hypothetical protein [Candidatus Omnitrophota bacterium]